MTHHEENPLIVMDASIATEANLAWLKERCCRYLVVSRKRHVEWDDEKLWRTYTMRTKRGDTVHIRKAARPEEWQQAIYKTLGLNQNPGGTMKTIVPD